MASAVASREAVKLLSIDGGGIRGLSALVLLEQLMDSANEHRRALNLEPQEPWQMFDLIGGTSTGGLIAIMLGRLRLSIAACKKAYLDLAQEAFTPKNFIMKIKEKITVGPQFKTGPLENAIQSIIGEDWPTTLLKEEDSQCKVYVKYPHVLFPPPFSSFLSIDDQPQVTASFVVAHIQDTNKRAILRSYRNITKPKASVDVMRLWEACRATSAAVTFFAPILVDGTTYSDGGLFYNNPVQLVHGEASEMFPDREQLIVSLGTGISGPRKFDPSLLSVAKLLADIATETENTADDFYRREGGKAAKARRYFRFNVPGIGDIAMEEPKRLNDIKLLTEEYLEGAELGQKTDLCTRELATGASPAPDGAIT